MQSRPVGTVGLMLLSGAIVITTGCTRTYKLTIMCDDVIKTGGRADQLVNLDFVSLSAADLDELSRALGVARPHRKEPKAAAMIDPYQWFHGDHDDKVRNLLGADKDRRLKQYQVKGGQPDIEDKLWHPSPGGKSAAIVVFADFHDAPVQSAAADGRDKSCKAKSIIRPTAWGGREVRVRVRENDINLEK